MNGQMDSIRGRVDSIFDDIDTQTGVTKSFAMQMGNISESYSVLSKDCLQSGHRILRWAGIWIRQEVIWYAAVQKLHSRTGCVYLKWITMC